MVKNWKKIKQSDEDSKQLLKKLLLREKIVDAIRMFFKQEGFREVETPLLVKHPGTEPYLEVFETDITTLNNKSTRGFLLTSPELQMKKLLAAGLGNIFQISKSFRNNEGISSFHNPEFSILEWYRTDADYKDIMTDCENLILFIFTQLGVNQNQRNILQYQDEEVNLSTPWERISVAEAFEKYAQITQEQLLSEDLLLEKAKEKGYEVNAQTTWEQIYNQILLNEIEPHLGKNKPTFLYDYPASQAALSKKKSDDPRFAERFELFINGIELGNAFSELTDAEEQKQRMVDDLALRSKLDKKKFELDDDFIEALEMGFPETGGIAVGVDRLVMLFADAESISQTMFFPAKDIFDL